MSVTVPTRTYAEIYEEGRRLAADGYGWQDLVVRLPVSENTAKLLVSVAECDRFAKAKEGRT
jgi:hypothetical protein